MEFGHGYNRLAALDTEGARRSTEVTAWPIDSSLHDAAGFLGAQFQAGGSLEGLLC